MGCIVMHVWVFVLVTMETWRYAWQQEVLPYVVHVTMGTWLCA